MDGAQSCAVERTGAADEAQPRAVVGHRTHQLLPFAFLAFPRFSNFPLCCRNPSVESRKSRSMKVSTFIAHQRRIKSQREITVPDRNGCVRNAWNKVGRIYWGPRLPHLPDLQGPAFRKAITTNCGLRRLMLG